MLLKDAWMNQSEAFCSHHSDHWTNVHGYLLTAHSCHGIAGLMTDEKAFAGAPSTLDPQCFLSQDKRRHSLAVTALRLCPSWMTASICKYAEVKMNGSSSQSSETHPAQVEKLPLSIVMGMNDEGRAYYLMPQNLSKYPCRTS